MSHWESVKPLVDKTVYGKGGKIGYKTREIFGSALDDFDPNLEDLEAKREAVHKAIGKVADPTNRETLEKSMTLSIAASYEKLRSTINYEKTLAPAAINAVFDSFLPEETPIASDFNESSYRESLKLVESLRRATQ
jgi:hypothetical protein